MSRTVAAREDRMCVNERATSHTTGQVAGECQDLDLLIDRDVDVAPLFCVVVGDHRRLERPDRGEGRRVDALLVSEAGNGTHDLLAPIEHEDVRAGGALVVVRAAENCAPYHAGRTFPRSRPERLALSLRPRWLPAVRPRRSRVAALVAYGARTRPGSGHASTTNIVRSRGGACLVRWFELLSRLYQCSRTSFCTSRSRRCRRRAPRARPVSRREQCRRMTSSRR